MRRHSIGLVLAVLAAPLAHPALSGEAAAQLLDFGAGAPAPGTGDWLLADAARLKEEADRLESGGSEGRVAPSAVALRAVLMRFAADLMERGEAEGHGGSRIALAGRTISARLADLDPLLGELSSADPAALETALAVAARAMEAEGDIDEVDRQLRAIMAPLAAHAGDRPNWATWTFGAEEEEPNMRELLFELESQRLVSKDALEALRAHNQRLDEAAGFTAFVGGVADTRRLIAGACAVTRLDERWLGDQRDALIDQLDEALIGLATDPEQARSALLRLALLDELVRRGQAVAPSGNSGRAFREAVQVACAAPEDLESAIGTLRFALGALRGVERGDRSPTDDDVVRQLRPAMRALQSERREARTRLIESTPDMLASASARTDPGVLSVVSAHAKALADIELVFDTSAVLTGPRPTPGPTSPDQPIQPDRPGVPNRPTSPSSPTPITPVPVTPGGGEPVASPVWQRIANVLLTLGQDMTRPSGGDEAAARMRELCTKLVARVEMPGEAEARGPLRAEFDQITGGRGGELLLAIGAAREAWLARVEDEGAGALDSSGEIDRLERLMPILADAMELFAHVRAALDARDGDRSCGRLSRIMAWELSSAAVLAMARDSREDLVRLTRLVLDNDHDWLEEVDKAAERHAVLLTIGRLEGLARAWNLPAFDTEARASAPPGAGVWELATGPAPTQTEISPLIELRPLLAELCRYAEEAYGDVPDPDPGERQAHAKYAAEVAERVRRAAEGLGGS